MKVFGVCDLFLWFYHTVLCLVEIIIIFIHEQNEYYITITLSEYFVREHVNIFVLQHNRQIAQQKTQKIHVPAVVDTAQKC